MPNVDHRQSVQIFRIRLTRNNAVIIRNELCMHTGFFAQVNNFFQSSVIFQCQRNGNFIQLVLRQDIKQIIRETMGFLK